jgi:hypothetical protein
METRIRILTRILELSEPAPLPARWASLGTTQSVRKLTCDPAALIAKLREDFDAEQLATERLTVSGPTGPELNAVFTGGRFMILADSEGRPIDASAVSGTMSGSEPPVMQLTAADQDGKRQQDCILLTSDADDLHVLDRIGLRSASAIGTAKLTGAQLRKIFARRRQPLYRLVIVGWQPAALVNKPSADAMDILNHLAAAERVFHLETWPQFAFWRPTNQCFELMRKALDFADSKSIRNLFRESILQSAPSVYESLEKIKDTKVGNFASLQSQLEREIRKAATYGGSAKVKRVLAQLNRSYRQSVTDKLFDSAGKLSHPIAAALGHAAGEVMTEWHEQSPLIKTAQRLISGNFRADVAEDRSISEERLELARVLLNLSRELHRYTKD